MGEKTAWIGLGVMGYPMAGHLAERGGHDVTVYNRSSDKAKTWTDKFGGKAAPADCRRVRDALDGADVPEQVVEDLQLAIDPLLVRVVRAGVLVLHLDALAFHLGHDAVADRTGRTGAEEPACRTTPLQRPPGTDRV